jgi:hypothetical protein
VASALATAGVIAMQTMTALSAAMMRFICSFLGRGGRLDTTTIGPERRSLENRSRMSDSGIAQ